MKTFMMAAVSALALSLSACDTGAGGTIESCVTGLVGTFEGDLQGGVSALLMFDPSGDEWTLEVGFVTDDNDEINPGTSVVDETNGTLTPNAAPLLKASGTFDFSDCTVAGDWNRGDNAGTWEASTR